MDWIKYKVKFEWFWDMRLGNSLYFIKLAWLTLKGKIGIITSKEVKSKGNYKFMNLTISKMPISKTHNYNDL